MVKEFQIFITPPSEGASTSDDIVISGHILLVTEKTKKSYLFIEVALHGYAKVGLRSDREQYENTTTVIDSTIEKDYFREDYVYNCVIVWKRENSPNHDLPPGSYQFPFVLKLQTSARPLPPSFEGRYGRIRYEVVATIVQAGMRISKRISEQVVIASVVDPNTVPDVELPKVLQVEKIFCCLCCASGPISLTARVPRTGYCVNQDAIPFEVDIENDSNKRIRRLVAQLQRRVFYTARNYHRVEVITLEEVSSDPIDVGRSLSWRPPPLLVPATEPTIANSSMIRVNYYLKVQASITDDNNLHVDFALFFGNVPLAY